MEVRDSFGNILKNKDCVVIVRCDKMILGIYNNGQILTEDGRVNINQINHILKLNILEVNQEMKRVTNCLASKYDKDLNSEKVVTLAELRFGQVVVTKSGVEWLVLGENWRMIDSKVGCLKSGRMYVKMQYIDENRSLKDNINNILEHCKTTDDLLKYFKFNNVKAVNISSIIYNEKDLGKFIAEGYIGIALGDKRAAILYNDSFIFERIYSKIKGITCYGSGIVVNILTSNIDRLSK